MLSPLSLSSSVSVPSDDTGYINENTTLTVANSATGEDGTDTDEDNESGDNTGDVLLNCLLYTSPSPRDRSLSRMPSSA